MQRPQLGLIIITIILCMQVTAINTVEHTISWPKIPLTTPLFRTTNMILVILMIEKAFLFNNCKTHEGTPVPDKGWL